MQIKKKKMRDEVGKIFMFSLASQRVWCIYFSNYLASLLVPKYARLNFYLPVNVSHVIGRSRFQNYKFVSLEI